MRLFSFVSVKLTVGLIIGILIGFYFGIAPNWPFFAILTLTCLLYWAYRKQHRDGFPFFELLFVCTTILLGIFIVGRSMPKNNPQHYSHGNCKEPGTWHLKIKEVLKPTPYAQRYVSQVIALENKKYSGKLILSCSLDSTAAPLKVDDAFFVHAVVQEIGHPRNPHQLDYKDYLKKQGIYHQIRANPKELLGITDPSRTIYGRASNFREHIIQKLKNENFGTEELAVIQALLLGERNSLSEQTLDSYKNAGAIHILAVSGLHVGILLLLLQFVLKPLEWVPKGKAVKLVVIVFLLWGYAYIAGLSPSIVRAVTMFTFLAYALYLDRPTNNFNIIALSMLFILLIKPLFLFQVGFQMSYAAVFSIVWIYPKLKQFWHPNNYLLRKLWDLLAVSAAAQLGVVPISLYYFHQFPALFFVSNLLVIPFLSVILGIGILVICLSLLNRLPAFIANTYNLIIKAMNGIVHWIGEQEGFLIQGILFDGVQMLLAYLIIITMVVVASRPKFKNVLTVLLGVMTFQGWTLWCEMKVQKKEAVILLHTTRNTALLHQVGSALHVHSSDTVSINSPIEDYAIAERIQTISFQSIKNGYMVHGNSIFILDSTGIYPKMKDLDYLVLTQSPKIHLERVLDSMQPKMVIADGSNYQGYVARWKKSCTKKQIPFHYTGEKGSYTFKLNRD